MLPLLLLALLAWTLPARAQSTVLPWAEADCTITTSGEATVYVVPDKVVANLGIETYDADLDRAKAVKRQLLSPVNDNYNPPCP
jgi:uncharacterized protein YggE